MRLGRRLRRDLKVDTLARNHSCGTVRAERPGHKFQAVIRRPFGHPQQRHAGQGGIGVAAADVAVHPGEPHLLQLLLWLLVFGAGLLVPQCRLEHCPLLVDSQRTKRTIDPGAELSAVGLRAVIEPLCDRLEPARTEGGDTAGPNGVPHAEEMDSWLVRVRPAEQGRCYTTRLAG